MTATITTIESVAVRFRLYNKLGSGGSSGTYKAQPTGPHKKQLREPFWLYLFLDDLSSIQLTHEIFVDPTETYHYFTDLFEGQPAPPSSPGVDNSTCAVLPMAHNSHNSQILCPYYALLSPFRMPKSRLDYIIPRGRISPGQSQKREQFLSWAKSRKLEMLLFNSVERKSALREFWAPWLKGAALADEYYATLEAYTQDYSEQAEIAQVADLAASLARSLPIRQYVSTTNIEAFKKEQSRLDNAVLNASTDVANYIAQAPFQEMLLDMWADKSEKAHLILVPYLAHCYQAVHPEKLQEIEAIDDRFLRGFFDQGLNLTRLGRRFLKAIVELNGTFGKAAILLQKAEHPRLAETFAGWAETWSKKILRIEMRRDPTTGLFDRESIDKLQRMRGASPLVMGFAGVLEIWALTMAIRSFVNAPRSNRNRAALTGAITSFTSSVLKFTQTVTPDGNTAELPFLQRELKELSTRIGPLEKSEQTLLSEWASRSRALKVGKIAWNKVLGRGLGAVSGLADAYTGLVDAGNALQVGDYDAAVGYGLVMAGGAMLVLGALFPVTLFWLAALGQCSELMGVLVAGSAESSDLGIWLRFCCFGERNWDKGNDSTRPWTGNRTLGEIAKSPKLQLNAFANIVYQMQIEAKIIMYRINGVDDPKLDITVRIPYGYPKQAQLYLRISVLREDGHVGVPRPLAPWPDRRTGPASTRAAQSGVSALFDPSTILLGSTYMFVHAWLDVTGNMDFYPEQRPITATFKIRDIPTVRA